MATLQPDQLRWIVGVLGVLSVVAMALRCYVRVGFGSTWGWDDWFMGAAFITHIWFSITLLTGLHYDTSHSTADITTNDSISALHCLWLSTLAYISTITLAKLSLGFFFFRVSFSSIPHRITTLVITASAALIGITYFFVFLFQCAPVRFFWALQQGSVGRCINVEAMIRVAYGYGSVTAITNAGFGVLAVVLTWQANMNRRLVLLVAPLLGLGFLAAFAALARMPYFASFRSDDFGYDTIHLTLWAAVEVGIVMVAANLVMLGPLVQRRGVRVDDGMMIGEGNFAQHVTEMEEQRPKFVTRTVALPSEIAAERQMDSESQISLTGSLRRDEGRLGSR